ncbi:MAG: MBL fold metallo-hydrolase [Solirubrobacterales bacterium]|nr:MBL fold metallo-hydrolase [Solirubrobacterales bacterium]MBV9799414.1 MBL fold metallo-hydrolase [Solirubrobacterales bacterium]
MCSVRLTFIGSGDAFASGGRFQACLLLEGAPEPLLIDCGASSLVALKRAGVDPASLGWVALSHLHGDHFAGLPFLILDGQFAGRTRPLVIAGPPGTRDRMERTFEALYPGATSAERAFETRFIEFEERAPCELGPAVITPFEVRHGSGAPAYALRVQYGERLIAYSGDTEWTDNLIAVADSADLFVCECNFFDREVPGHLDYRTLAAHRNELTCRRLVITHMQDDMLARVGEADVEAASDGAVFTL